MKKTIITVIALSGIGGMVAINSMPLKQPVNYVNSPVLAEKEVAVENTSTHKVIDVAAATDATSTIDGKWVGLCPKDSVDSVASFRNTVMDDPVLALEYQRFGWSSASVGQLDEEAEAHVTHRQGNTILKSRKPIKLPKGDRYITDGITFVRLYCCNSFSSILTYPPPKPIEESVETGIGEQVVFQQGVPVALPGYLYYGHGSYGSYYTGDSANFIIDDYSTVPGGDSEITCNPVPEPGTMLLFGFGLAVVGVVARWGRD